MKNCFLIIAWLSVLTADAQRFDPVNPDASAEARKLLSYLYDIDEKKNPVRPAQL